VGRRISRIVFDAISPSRNTAYVVTLGGEVWRVDNIAGPPFGH
jgi:hypothetical protein